MEQLLAALFSGNAGNAPGKAQVPFGDAITELSHIYPEVPVSGTDDVPYLEVSVKAKGILGNRLDEIHNSSPEEVRDHLLVLIERQQPLFHGGDACSIGRRSMDTPCERCEFFAQRFQAIGFFRDDTCEGPFVLYQLIFSTVALTVRDKTDGKWSGNPKFIDGLRSGKLLSRHICGKALCE